MSDNEEYPDVLNAMNERFKTDKKSLDDFTDQELRRLYMEVRIYQFMERGAQVFMCKPKEYK